MLIDRFDPLAIVFSETPIEVIEALALEQLQIFRRRAPKLMPCMTRKPTPRPRDRHGISIGDDGVPRSCSGGFDTGQSAGACAEG